MTTISFILLPQFIKYNYSFSSIDNFSSQLKSNYNIEEYLIIADNGEKYGEENLQQLDALILKQNVLEIVVINTENLSGSLLNINIKNDSIQKLQRNMEVQNIAKKYINKFLENEIEKNKTAYLMCNELSSSLKEENNQFKNKKLTELNNFNEIDSSINFEKYEKLIKETSTMFKNMIQGFTDEYEQLDGLYHDFLNKLKDIKNECMITIEDSNQNESKKDIFINNCKYFYDIIDVLFFNDDFMTMENRLNKLVILGKKINFYQNISSIPTFLENNKKTIEIEINHRKKFNYIYTSIINYLENNLLEKEFQHRKEFISGNIVNAQTNAKVDSKTIEVINDILNLFANSEKKIKTTDKIISGQDILDGEIKKDMNNLKILFKKINNILYNEEVCKEEDKTEENINNKNEEFNENIKEGLLKIANKNLKLNLDSNISINNLINEIDKNTKNFSCKNLNNSILFEPGYLEESFNEYGPFNKIISHSYLDSKEKINENTINAYVNKFEKIIQFYNKLFDYLSAFQLSLEQPKIKNIILDKNEPFSIISYIVGLMNENIKLNKIIQKVKLKLTE